MTDEEKRNKVKSFDRCVCERARALRSVRHLLDLIAFHFISFAISSLSSLKKWSQYFLFLLAPPFSACIMSTQVNLHQIYLQFFAVDCATASPFHLCVVFHILFIPLGFGLEIDGMKKSD